MNRRWRALTGALALAVAAPQAAAAAAPLTVSAAGVRADRGTGAENGLARLRADANGRLRVHRSADGAVDFVSSSNGRAMVGSPGSSSPGRSVTGQLARYGQTFGIDGTLSRAVVSRTTPSSTGGSVVRAEQVVDGVPVFGGQIVMSLDADQGVVSVSAATTVATEVAAARVSEARARALAVAVTARTHHVATGSLTVLDQGRKLYDPAVVHVVDPLGVRPVWAFEVSNAVEVRETVLVGTRRGEVALHFNNTAALNRRICDNANKHTVSSSAQVPACATPARVEGGAARNVEVDAAYDNLGATSQAYAELDGLDLTDLIGFTRSGTKALAATVRWCFSDDDCPYPNAFWDGHQMVFGAGYARADDVVAHELTHGYVARTADLFYLHQSGALNESLADTIGEIVDHRNPLSPQSDSSWTLGEDLGIPAAVRSMLDPTLHAQPDKMTSSYWHAADADDDNGAVHTNDGVGNKTAYLISQGGTFNNQSVTGIDGTDTGLAKTGRLYLETIPRLTSGAEYADLGRVLTSTCDQLAAQSTGGFTAADCTQVRAAAAATELSSPPTRPGAAAAEAPISCPSGGSVGTVLLRDDDDVDSLGFSSTSSLWGRAPALAPSYATSGTASLFAYDPDPGAGDPSSGSMTSAPFTVPATTGGTYLNFHHAYVLDWSESAYYDGGEVVVTRLVGGAWTTVTGLPWVNGPTRHVRGSRGGFTGFGGDSHGYGSSQVDLSSLAGQRVRVAFRIEGDRDTAYYGWWIDDVRLYGCDTAALPLAAAVAPSAPTSASVSAASTSATVSWKAPVDQGSAPVAAYRVTRPDGGVIEVSGTSARLSGLDATSTKTVTVRAVNQDALLGAPATVRIYPTTVTITTSTTRASSNKPFTVTAKVVRRGGTAVIRSMPVVLQRRVSGASTWRNVSSARTGSKGTASWSTRLTATTAYRAVAQGVTYNFGSVSTARVVKRR